MTFRSFVAIFALCAIFGPQLLISIPYLGEQVKTPDLFAALTLPLAILMCFPRLTLRKTQVTAFLAIVFATAVVFARVILDSDRELYRENLPYLARLFSIHAPLFLVVAMPRDRRMLYKCMIGFGVLATVASFVMAVLYHFGSTAFDAHQTFQRQGGDLSHRLGGLQGETGAFAFNATIGIQLLLVGLAMANLRKQYYLVLWGVFPLFCALIYHESLARVSLLNSLIFFFVSLVGVNHSRINLRFIAFIVILVGSTAVLLLSAAGIPLIDFEIERVNFDGNLEQLSSGRLSHWIAASKTWFDNPSYILFGTGHRASDFVLGHPVENMFVFHLLNYGIIGSVLFGSLYVMLVRPIFQRGIQGDFGAGVFSAMLLSVVVQWQVNDVNLFYQTFPCILFFSAWYTAVLQQEKSSTNENS